MRFNFATRTVGLTFLLSLGGCGGGGSSVQTAQQRLVETELVNSDGTSVTLNYEYGIDGNLIQRTVRVDGGVDSLRTYVTSSNGLLQSYSDDLDLDGEAEFIAHFRYTAGTGLTRINVENSDGRYVSSIEYSHNNGVIVSRESYNIVDVDSEELIELRPDLRSSYRTYSYEAGRLNEQIFLNEDGSVSRTRTYTYNPDGTLASSTTNSTTEGTTQTSTHTYEVGSCNSNANLSTVKYRCVD